MLTRGTIINLTPYSATPEQVVAGVFDLCGNEGKKIRELLTFTELPLGPEVRDRAHSLAILAASITPEVTGAMIGGAPYLMGPLHLELLALGILPMYSFSRRKSIEAKQPDGTIVKASPIAHVGFVTLHFPMV